MVNVRSLEALVYTHLIVSRNTHLTHNPDEWNGVVSLTSVNNPTGDAQTHHRIRCRLGVGYNEEAPL